MSHVWEVHVPTWGDESCFSTHTSIEEALVGLERAKFTSRGVPREAYILEVYFWTVAEWSMRAERKVAD